MTEKQSNGFAKVLTIGLTVILAAGSLVAHAAGEAHDFMVVVNRPNLMQVIDLKQRKVVRTCKLPGSSAPGTLVMSPDHRIAYVLANRFSDIYGMAIDSCRLVFSAEQSYGNVRVKSMAAIALSPDGRTLYTHQNPVRLLPDHYEIMDTRVALFDTSTGLHAKPVRTYPAPRQVNIMATDRAGMLYLSGPDVYAMNPATGHIHTVIASRSLHRPGWGPRDVLTVWPVGDVSHEFIRMYTVEQLPDKADKGGKGRLWWGYERIDLDTGKASSHEFGLFGEVLFSGMTRPGHPNEMYAVLSRLKHFDVAHKREVKSVNLDHSYYCINFSTDGSKIYLAGSLNDIAIYDADSLAKIGDIKLSGGDMAMSTPRIFRRKVVN